MYCYIGLPWLALGSVGPIGDSTVRLLYQAATVGSGSVGPIGVSTVCLLYWAATVGSESVGPIGDSTVCLLYWAAMVGSGSVGPIGDSTVCLLYRAATVGIRVVVLYGYRTHDVFIHLGTPRPVGLVGGKAIGENDPLTALG